MPRPVLLGAGDVARHAGRAYNALQTSGANPCQNHPHPAMVKVSLPLFLTDITGGAREAEVQGATLDEVITALDEMHPGIAAKVRDGGKLAPIVALTVDGRIAARGLDTPVQPDSQVRMLPAFGGG